MKQVLILFIFGLLCENGIAQTLVFKKIAQRHDDYINNTWQGDDSLLFSYNNDAIPIGVFAMKATNNTWDNWYRYTYTLNGMGKVTLQLREDWSVGAWVNTNRYTYTYDGNGNNTEILYDVWNGTSWNPTGKITYNGYNAYSKWANEYVFGYSGGMWVNQTWRKKNYLNNQYLVSEDERYLWIGGMWKKYERLYLTYVQEEVGSIIRSIPDINDQWTARDKYIYNYNLTPFHLIEYIVQKMDTVNFVWDDVSRLTYSYTPSDKVDQTQNDIFTNNWIPVSRTQSVYNGNDFLIEYYTEDNNNGNWLKNSRSTYTYINTLVNEELTYLGVTNTWAQDKRLSFLYNAQDSLVYRQEENFTGANFVSASQDFYYYQSFVVGLIENSETQNTLQAYPNPAHEKLYVISNSTQGELLQFNIVDIMGRTWLMRTQPATTAPVDISLEGIPAGTYFLQCIESRTGRKEVKKIQVN